jgi:hypothetical protein
MFNKIFKRIKKYFFIKKINKQLKDSDYVY